MKSRKKQFLTIFALFLPIALAWLAFSPKGRSLLFSQGVSAETQGYVLARDLGCFQCHGDWGQGGLGNPGTKGVPGFQDFAFLMDIKDEAELRSWILDGAPDRIRAQSGFLAAKNKRAMAMPAYRDVINAKQLDLLVTFFQGISGIVWPDDPQAQAGFKAAKRHGCFGCHGIGGRFDVPNPGSFVGRIPAWNGEDFAELARNEEEIRSWILDGEIARFANHPVAAYFLKRQVLRMPAYRGLIPAEDVDAIIHYLRWLRDPGLPGHQPDYSGGEETSILDDFEY